MGEPEGNFPKPEDLIDKETWFEITYHPDDVSLRTSDNHGDELKIMSKIVEHINSQYSCHEFDPLWPFFIDITIEFQASLFNLLYGYYRVSAACLRNALELSLYALYFQDKDDMDQTYRWLCGNYDNDEFSHIQGLGNVCNQLNNIKSLKNVNFILLKKIGFSLFNQRSPNISQGISRQIHSRLSEYVHSRPGYNHTDHWNDYEYGPVYSSESFKNISRLFLDTFLHVDLIIKLGRSNSSLNTELYEIILMSKLKPLYFQSIILELIWSNENYDFSQINADKL